MVELKEVRSTSMNLRPLQGAAAEQWMEEATLYFEVPVISCHVMSEICSYRASQRTYPCDHTYDLCLTYRRSIANRSVFTIDALIDIYWLADTVAMKVPEGHVSHITQTSASGVPVV